MNVVGDMTVVTSWRDDCVTRSSSLVYPTLTKGALGCVRGNPTTEVVVDSVTRDKGGGIPLGSTGQDHVYTFRDGTLTTDGRFIVSHHYHRRLQISRG